MKIAGIISEFNPFHKGHKYLIDSVRRDLNPDAVVCVMSGNFVQRGEAALWDKRSRAAMAVSCGADLVIELPVCYAVNGASEFAFGGVSVLNAIGADYLCFGSECGDIHLIDEIAENLYEESSEFSCRLKTLINGGLSYPEAYSDAVSGKYPGFLDGSNNILALEYVKQIKKLKSTIIPYTVKRQGAGHDSMSSDGNYVSASYLRSCVDNNIDITNILSKYLPEEAVAYTEGYIDRKAFDSGLFSLISYKLLTEPAENLSGILEMGEGLENKLRKEIITSESLDDLILKVKSKRYTYARISRILIQLALGITKDLYAEVKNSGLFCTMVLAADKKGLDVLHEIKKNPRVQLVSNLNKAGESLLDLPSLKTDIAANDIFSVFSGRNIYKYSDYVCSPCLIGIK